MFIVSSLGPICLGLKPCCYSNDFYFIGFEFGLFPGCFIYVHLCQGSLLTTHHKIKLAKRQIKDLLVQDKKILHYF